MHIVVRGEGGEVRRLDEIYRAHLFGDLYVLCTDMKLSFHSKLEEIKAEFGPLP